MLKLLRRFKKLNKASHYINIFTFKKTPKINHEKENSYFTINRSNGLNLFAFYDGV